MSHSQFHCIDCLYLDMHGLIFETSVCYWQNQPGCYFILSLPSYHIQQILPDRFEIVSKQNASWTKHIPPKVDIRDTYIHFLSSSSRLSTVFAETKLTKRYLGSS